MKTGVWEDLYQSLQKPQLDPVITGFNANIDRVISMTPELLIFLEQHGVKGFDTILPRLKQSMRYCSADEIFIREPSEFYALSEPFSLFGTLSVGGQAGITAVHLRRMGVPSVTCAAPGAGPIICGLLQDAGVNTLTFESGADNRSDIIHLIFEYPPNLVPLADRVVPRNNRFIVSPLHDTSTVIIPEASVPSFLDEIITCRRAFLSGYQYLQTEQECMAAARQIRMIRSVHPLMRTHVECVSGAGQKTMLMMFRYIFPNTDSIGLNEQELGSYMHLLRTPHAAPSALLPYSPVACVRDAIALAKATGVSRIHVHAFGYYVLVLKSGTPDPEVSRNALLLAAQVTADTAQGGDQVLSREGLRAYAAVQEGFGPDKTTGIFEHDDYLIVIVPTRISQNIQKTTGLGDILSSTAFVADRF
jgi:ADP-dependent phosphofructokinase/glucokinase